MLQSVGNLSPAAQVIAQASQPASGPKSPAAASSQTIQDILSISSQGQAAGAKVDADGDHDGH